MEAEEIQAQRCKFSRGGSNGRTDTTTTKLGLKGSNSNGTSHHQFPDDEDGELKRVNSNAIVSIGGGGGDGGNRLRGWHHNSSRIIRVSRASGGKDRHSKVWTSKGLRDRRVRLSVTTAIQFYDLQDRLGYDQPSKAVEWLINAAADAISELPSLSSSFPETPKQLSDGKRGNDDQGAEHGFDSADLELEDPNFSLGGGNHNQNQQLSLSKSACSSTSETSKGSGLSLARSDARVKARERARERTAKEKEKDGDHQHQNVNPISQNSTFTELLTGGISGTVSNNNNNNNPSDNTSSPTGSEANFFHKAAGARQWPLAPMDYFGTGLFGQSSSRSTHHSSGFSGQIQLGNTVIPQAAMTMSIPPFHISGENHHHHQQHQHHHNHQEQMQHFPFDHLIPVATPTTTAQQGSGGDYNLNFTISSGLSGFNRGTLQSNSSSVHSLLPHIQRFSSSSSLEGSTSVPFFIGAAPPQPMENHHHHQFPPGLQLCYGDGSRHSHDQKGKGKN